MLCEGQELQYLQHLQDQHLLCSDRSGPLPGCDLPARSPLSTSFLLQDSLQRDALLQQQARLCRDHVLCHDRRSGGRQAVRRSQGSGSCPGTCSRPGTRSRQVIEDCDSSLDALQTKEIETKAGICPQMSAFLSSKVITQMAKGFLGYPSTLMLDVVVCALVLVVPVLLYSIYLVKFRRNYLWHRNLQTALGAALLLTVSLFEIDMRLHGGWQQILKNREVQLEPDQLEWVRQILLVHLVFAVSAVLLWAVTLTHGWKRIPNPPQPSPHSGLHKWLGWSSTITLTLTSVTGLIFYYYAFVA